MNKNLTFIVISSTNDLSVEKTLKSIAGVAPVLLIDGGARKHFSSSREEISLSDLAKKYSIDYVARDFINASDQYNYGIENVKTTWAFIIDSDETLSDNLRYFLNRGDFRNATHFSVKRFNYFLGKKMRHGQFRPDWNIRLINVERCKYEVRAVHARMIADGKGAKAPGYIVHDTVQTIDSFFLKMLEFTKLEIDSRANGNLSGEKKARLRRIFQKLPFQATLRFIYSYWFRLGILDGRRGYLLAKSASYYEVMVELNALGQDG